MFHCHFFFGKEWRLDNMFFYLVKVGKDEGKSISKLRVDNFPYFRGIQHQSLNAGHVYFGVAVNGLIQGFR